MFNLLKLHYKLWTILDKKEMTVHFKMVKMLIFKINLFIYFWLRWVFVAALRLSLVVASRGYSLLRCAGF